MVHYTKNGSLVGHLLMHVLTGQEFNPNKIHTNISLFFVQINLIAAPLYVITTTTLDKDDGLKALIGAVAKIRESIKSSGGEFNEKTPVSLLLYTEYIKPFGFHCSMRL